MGGAAVMVDPWKMSRAFGQICLDLIVDESGGLVAAFSTNTPSSFMCVRPSSRFNHAISDA